MNNDYYHFLEHRQQLREAAQYHEQQRWIATLPAKPRRLPLAFVLRWLRQHLAWRRNARKQLRAAYSAPLPRERLAQ